MRVLGRLLLALFALAAAFIALGPIVWALSTSLKRNADIFAVPPRLVPTVVTAEHYLRLFAEGVHWTFLNSLAYAVVAVTAAVSIGAIAGYALARYRFRGRDAVLLLFMGAMAVPSYALLLPTQILFVELAVSATVC